MYFPSFGHLVSEVDPLVTNLKLLNLINWSNPLDFTVTITQTKRPNKQAWNKENLSDSGFKSLVKSLFNPIILTRMKWVSKKQILLWS